MRKIFALFAFAAVATAIPAGAQPAVGMDAMDYYVGRWACVGGPTSIKPVNATVTAVMNGGVLNQSISVPAQPPGVKTAISQTEVFSYDAKGRYIETLLDNTGAWSVSYAKPWTGNTEQWTDITTSDGKLGHVEEVRTDQDHYTVTAYGTPTGTTPVFKATCRRQPS